MRLADFPFLYLSSVVTCISPVLKPYYERHRPVVVIPNGVDLDPRVAVEDARRTLDAQDVLPEFYVLFAAGRIIPFKGCHLLSKPFNASRRP